MIDLNIENGMIVTGAGSYNASISVNAGKIVGVGSSPRSRAESTIDATGLLIFPGFIDAHVHFKEPAGPEDENFETGTSAAASGGVTTVIDMPGSRPAVMGTSELEEKKRIVRKKARVDYALFGAAGSTNIQKIQQLARGGVVGYKTFMTSGPDYTAEDDSILLQIMEKIGMTGLVSAVHAEVGSLVTLMAERFAKGGKNSPAFHPKSRPNLFELLAIQRVVEISHSTGTRAHIVHMSTKEGVEAIASAKRLGYTVTAETCPHYLLLTEGAMDKLGPYAKINPPLRSAADQAALWQGVRDGTIDFIASDHAPHTRAGKDVGWKDIWKARAGNPGLETMVMLVLTKASQGLISYSDAARLLSEKPARVYGLYPRKGAIQVGSDADFTIVDMKRKVKLSKGRMYSRSKFATLYDGWTVTGIPKYTIVRGVIVSEDREVIGKPGFGKLQLPSSN